MICGSSGSGGLPTFKEKTTKRSKLYSHQLESKEKADQKVIRYLGKTVPSPKHMAYRVSGVRVRILA